MKQFEAKPGDVVKNGEGRLMTVEGYTSAGDLMCVWLDGEELKRELMDPRKLTKPVTAKAVPA